MSRSRHVIQPVELFHTPKDWKELQGWIERHDPSDRPHLYTAAMMAWNLAAKFTTPQPRRSLKKELKSDAV